MKSTLATIGFLACVLFAPVVTAVVAAGVLAGAGLAGIQDRMTDAA